MALLAVGVYPVLAQVAPALPAGKEQEAVKLDPFRVSADSDVGFVAASSLAGGRIATALKDTPVAYSVITKEFLDAFQITDVVQAAEWSTSSYNMAADQPVSGGGSTQSSTVSIRGIRAGTPLRNYFQTNSTPDSYSLDRIDFGRGPNAVLYGTGVGTGTQNSITKQALLSKPIREVTFRFGTWDRYRFTVDINQPVTDKLAARVNMLWDQGRTWKDHEWNRKKGIQFAATYQVSPKFTVRGEVEYMYIEQSGFTNMKDQISAWDGVTILPTSLPLTGTGAPTPAALAQAGLTRATAMRFVSFQGEPSWGGQAFNFQNEFRTKGAAQSTTAANTNYINGMPIRTVGFSLNNQAVNDLLGITPQNRWARALAGSPIFHMPTRTENLLYPNKYPISDERDLSQTITLNYKLNEHFFAEVAGNINRAYVIGRQTTRRGLNEQRIDLDRFLPNGNPNPYFLHVGSEFMDYNNDRLNTYQNLRAQMMYTQDTRVGKLQIGVTGALINYNQYSRGSFQLLPMTSIAPDARTWDVNNGDLNLFGYYGRTYLDKNPEYWPKTAKSRPVSVYNPVNGVTQTVTPTWMWDAGREDNNVNNTRKYKYGQAAGNLDLFKNHLVLIAAVRRDEASLTSQRVLPPGQYPAGWDGTTIQFRKPTPADYFDLTYIPKDATGKAIAPPAVADVRPTININNAQIPAPQYINDRFRDDFNSPGISPKVNTTTVGAVVNITKTLGVYANRGTTFEISAPFQRLDGSLCVPTSAQGKDAGIRYTLPGGRLSVSAGWYNSSQKGALVDLTVTGPYNTFANTPVVGDFSLTGQNIRGAKVFPQTAIKDTVDTTTTGYEFEMTANLTQSWRLIFNASQNYTELNHQLPDQIGYFKTQDAVSRQILADAGIQIDSTNHAQINPALDDPTKINQTKAQAAVDAWNNLVDVVQPSLVNRPNQRSTGSIPLMANVATDYRLRTGPLKGLRVGLGLNYRQGMIVGYKASDTIQDPNNPANAIPDPTINAATPVYGNTTKKFTATFNYTYRFKEKNSRFAPKTINFDLNIDNLLDNKNALYGYSTASSTTAYTILVPRNGDWTQPARKTVPGTPYYFAPRSFLLTAKLSF